MLSNEGKEAFDVLEQVAELKGVLLIMEEEKRDLREKNARLEQELAAFKEQHHYQPYRSPSRDQGMDLSR